MTSGQDTKTIPDLLWLSDGGTGALGGYFRRRLILDHGVFLCSYETADSYAEKPIGKHSFQAVQIILWVKIILSSQSEYTSIKSHKISCYLH